MPMRRRGARDQGGADWIAQDSCCVTQMEFAEAIMEDPHKTLEEVLDESGLRGQAKVSVHGEDEAGAKLESWIFEHHFADGPILEHRFPMDQSG